MKYTTKAQAAIRAAKNYNRWGGHAAVAYASRHGVSITMLCIALALSLGAPSVRKAVQHDLGSHHEAGRRVPVCR